MTSQGRFSRAKSFTLLTLVVLLPITARATSSPDDIRIYNFGRVSDTYFRGSQPEGDNYEQLAAAGIKTVIDLQADGLVSEPGLVKSTGMNYYRIPMTTRVPPTDTQVSEFLRIVNDPAQQPVYVHCQGGRHRTGVMTAIYRMTQEGWTSDQAFQEMKKYNFGPDFLHPEFKKYVYQYQPSRVPGITLAASK